MMRPNGRPKAPKIICRNFYPYFVFVQKKRGQYENINATVNHYDREIS